MRVQVASATASTYTSLRSLNRVRKGDSTVMSRVKSRSLRVPTAAGSIAVALLSFGVAACGGTGDRRPPENLVTADAGLSVDPCNPSATLEMQLIGCSPEILATHSDTHCPDFERGAVTNGKTDPDPLPLTSAATYSSIDSCKNAPPGTDCISPNGIMDFYPMVDNQGNRSHCGGGTNAYHMVARGQLRWGPQAYIQYDNDPYPAAQGIDVSEWDGLAFWVRKGSEPSGNAVFVSLFDRVTNGLAPNSQGKFCDTSATAPDPVKCDQFGFSVSYGNDWEYKVLAFEDLKQRGFGVHEDTLDLQHIIMLKFGFEVGDYWDVWIDDIALWRKK